MKVICNVKYFKKFFSISFYYTENFQIMNLQFDYSFALLALARNAPCVQL